MTRADKHQGFVWGVDGDNIIIALHRGGKLQTRNKGGFDTGDKVAVIFDPNGNTVLGVRSMIDVETAIRCGSDPIFEAAIRATEELPTTEEEIYDGDTYGESDDVFGCGG